MPDRDKVIKGLCEAVGVLHGYVPKRYWGYGEQACRDAIALLKEQDLDIGALKNTIQGMVEGQVIIAGDRRVDVVRCKDCTYLNADTGICIVGIPHGHKDTFYCAYGKRR